MRTILQINNELQQFDNYVQALDYEDLKDMQILNDVLVSLAKKLARSASLVAEAAKLRADAKRNAYHTYAISAKAQGQKLSPMILKDYIDNRCSDEMACDIYADRINRMLTHTMDVLRSILSAQKEEFKTLKYIP